jgi:hypothetical protein
MRGSWCRIMLLESQNSLREIVSECWGHCTSGPITGYPVRDYRLIRYFVLAAE